jgi:hypothetical protein
MQLDPRVFGVGGGVDLASRHYGLMLNFWYYSHFDLVLDADQTVNGPLWSSWSKRRRNLPTPLS